MLNAATAALPVQWAGWAWACCLGLWRFPRLGKALARCFLLPASKAIAASDSPRPGLRGRVKSRCQWSSNEGREREGEEEGEKKQTKTREEERIQSFLFSLFFLFFAFRTNASGRLEPCVLSKSIKRVDQQHRIDRLDT